MTDPATGPATDAHTGALRSLFFARIVNSFAFSFSFPFLATYFAHERAVAATAVGAIYMAQGLTGALSQLPGGCLADRFGRRRMLVVSLAARTLLVLALGLGIRANAPVLVVAALMVVNAFFSGLFQPAADALVADLAPAHRRIDEFARQRVAINAGWAAGPVMGGLLVGPGAFERLFLAAAPVIALAAAMMARLPDAGGRPAQRHDRSSPLRVSGPLSDPAIRLQLLGALLTFVLAGQMVVTLSVDAGARLGVDEKGLGLLWTLNGVLVVFAQMPAARLVSRMGSRAALVAGSLVYGLGYASIGFATGYGHLVASMVAVTAGELLNAPAQQSAMAERTRPQHMGRALGLLGLVMTLGRSLGPFVGGATRDAFAGQPRLVWGVLGFVGAVAALVYSHPALRASRRDEHPGGE